MLLYNSVAIFMSTSSSLQHTSSSAMVSKYDQMACVVASPLSSAKFLLDGSFTWYACFLLLLVGLPCGVGVRAPYGLLQFKQRHSQVHGIESLKHLHLVA